MIKTQGAGSTKVNSSILKTNKILRASGKRKHRDVAGL